MDERRGGLRTGVEYAELVGDAVMSSLADLVERLRDVPEEAVAAPRPVTPTEPTAADSAGHPPSLPGLPRPLVNLVAALVAAIVPVVISRMDLNEVLDQVNIQRVVNRVDVEKVVERLDLNEVAGRIDVDALLARVDIDALVKRIDLTSATREAMEAIDIGEIVRDSTATIGTDLVDDLRLRAIRADALLARFVDWVLRRRGPRRTALEPPAGAS